MVDGKANHVEAVSSSRCEKISSEIQAVHFQSDQMHLIPSTKKINLNYKVKHSNLF